MIRVSFRNLSRGTRGAIGELKGATTKSKTLRVFPLQQGVDMFPPAQSVKEFRQSLTAFVAIKECSYLYEAVQEGI